MELILVSKVNCPPCEKLLPIWEVAVEEISLRSRVVKVKDRSELPEEIEVLTPNFPQILFRDSSGTLERYNGKLDPISIIQFVQEATGDF